MEGDTKPGAEAGEKEEAAVVVELVRAAGRDKGKGDFDWSESFFGDAFDEKEVDENGVRSKDVTTAGD